VVHIPQHKDNERVEMADRKVWINFLCEGFPIFRAASYLDQVIRLYALSA